MQKNDMHLQDSEFVCCFVVYMSTLQKWKQWNILETTFPETRGLHAYHLGTGIRGGQGITHSSIYIKTYACPVVVFNCAYVPYVL